MLKLTIEKFDHEKPDGGYRSAMNRTNSYTVIELILPDELGGVLLDSAAVALGIMEAVHKQYVPIPPVDIERLRESGMMP